MMEKIHENKIYKDIVYSGKDITDREFIECTFINCNMSSSDLSRTEFTECIFENCNLSMVVLDEAVINDVKFVDCKLTGIDFSVSNELIFDIECENCKLDYSSFYQRKMPKTTFTNCSLREVDFCKAMMKESNLINCEFHKSIFSHTNLEKCDFSTSRDFNIDPSDNIVKKAKFSINEVMGLLGNNGIILVP